MTDTTLSKEIPRCSMSCRFFSTLQSKTISTRLLWRYVCSLATLTSQSSISCPALLDSCSGAGMTVGRRRARGACPRGNGERVPRGGNGAGPPMRPRDGFLLGGRNDGWGRRARGSGYPEGGMGRGLPCAPGMDSCFRRNGCGQRRDTDIAPHDHPCEGRGPLRSLPFDKLRVNGKIRPVRGFPPPVRGELVEPCERAKGALRQAQGERSVGPVRGELVEPGEREGERAYI